MILIKFQLTTISRLMSGLSRPTIADDLLLLRNVDETLRTASFYEQIFNGFATK